MEENLQMEPFTPRKLPTLQELHYDDELAYKNDQFNQLVSFPPSKTWIKKHPMVNVKNEQGKNIPLEYLPVDKVKTLLTRIFGGYEHEIKDVKLILNSVVVVVRLWYIHPVTGKRKFHDGIGAVAVQTDKGATALDISSIKFDGVMKAAPAADSYALKNAAEKIGPLFGSTLGKHDTLPFKSYYNEPEKDQPSYANIDDLEVQHPEVKIPEADLKLAEQSGWQSPPLDTDYEL